MATTNGSDVTAYDYDAFGNLRSVVLPDATEIEYVIDARQRRVGKKVDGQLVQGFLYWNQLKPVAELDGAGNVVSTFVYGRNPYVPEYMVKGGVTYRLVTDHVGSVRLVVKTQDGTVAQRIDYDEWGRVLQDTNPGFQPFGFAGGLYDADTGLVRFGYRDYDPKTGRWTARDPILFGGGQINLYLYCHGDPVNWVDPWGLGEETSAQESLIWGTLRGFGAALVSAVATGIALSPIARVTPPVRNWALGLAAASASYAVYEFATLFSSAEPVSDEVMQTIQREDPSGNARTGSVVNDRDDDGVPDAIDVDPDDSTRGYN